MQRIVFSNHLHGFRVALRAIVSLLLLLACVIIVALLRHECHLTSLLVCASVLVGINIYSCVQIGKNRYTITDSTFLIEEYHVWRKSIALAIPISMIDTCELSGWRPFQSIRLTVHGHPYLIRHVSSAADIVEIINNKKCM